MKMTSIIKTVVAVTAIVTVGKVVYDRVKANKETDSEEVKTTIDEVVEDDEPEPEKEEKSIIEKFDIFTDSLTLRQKTVCTVSVVLIGGLFGGIIGGQAKKDVIKKVENDINNDPVIKFMTELSSMTLKAIRMGVISYNDLIVASELYSQEVQ